MQTQQFQKFERLSGKRTIAFLFEQGQSFALFPFKCITRFHSEDLTFPVQVVFTVSKKHFPNATQRNKVKRLLREAYRKNKQSLINLLLKKNKKLHIAVIFTSKELPNYKLIEQKLIIALNKIEHELATMA